MWDSGRVPGTSPSLSPRFQRTVRERMSSGRLQESHETVGACPGIFKDQQAALSSKQFCSLELFYVDKTRKPLRLQVLCFPNDWHQTLCAQTIASGTSRPGWAEEPPSVPTGTQTKSRERRSCENQGRVLLSHLHFINRLGNSRGLLIMWCFSTLG